MHGPRRSTRSASARSGAQLTVLLLAAVALVLLAGAGVASASPKSLIFDAAATPSWTAGVPGTGAGEDNAFSVVAASLNVQYIAGWVTNAAGNDDISYSKFQGGVLAWTKTWDGGAGKDDSAAQVVLSADGKWLYICGTSGTATTSRVVVIKASANTGAIKWKRFWDSSSSRGALASAIGLDASGNLYVCGATVVDPATADIDYAVVSWTAAGRQRWAWQRDVGGHSTDYALDEYVAPDGTVYVTGFGVTSASQAFAGVARLTSGGAVRWFKKYTSSAGIGAFGNAVTPRPGGGVYVAGVALTGGSTTAGMVAAFKANGSVQAFPLDTESGTATRASFDDVSVTSTGMIVAVGGANALGATRPHITVYRPDTSVFTTASFAGIGSDEFTDCAVDEFGGFYAAGTTHLSPTAQVVAVLRASTLTSAGLWTGIWAAGASQPNEPNAIDVFSSTLFVAGHYNSMGATGVDQFLLAYNY